MSNEYEVELSKIKELAENVIAEAMLSESMTEAELRASKDFENTALSIAFGFKDGTLDATIDSELKQDATELFLENDWNYENPTDDNQDGFGGIPLYMEDYKSEPEINYSSDNPSIAFPYDEVINDSYDKSVVKEFACLVKEPFSFEDFEEVEDTTTEDVLKGLNVSEDDIDLEDYHSKTESKDDEPDTDTEKQTDSKECLKEVEDTQKSKGQSM